jgi:cell division protein FtsL
MNRRLSQAQKQAPWRIRIQSAGMVFLILAGAIVVAALYLSVSAQAANAGLELQDLDNKKQDLEDQIADQETFLAWLDSTTKMEERATALGFERISADRALYVAVPGYTGPKPVLLAPLPGSRFFQDPVIKPGYTQSIWDWLFEGVRLSGNQ